MCRNLLPTHLLTYSPTHLLTYSPTHLLTRLRWRPFVRIRLHFAAFDLELVHAVLDIDRLPKRFATAKRTHANHRAQPDDGQRDAEHAANGQCPSLRLGAR